MRKSQIAPIVLLTLVTLALGACSRVKEDWKAAQAAARWPGKVIAQICEEGLNDKDAWPATSLAAADAFAVPAFAIADLPAKYVDDVNLPNVAYGYVLRASYAHAKVKSIDTSAAKKAPGVIAVLTADDIAEFSPGTVSGVGAE